MDDVLTLLVAGISVGSIYGLIAIGLNLTFWTTRTLNFGQGSVMMLCAIVAAFLAGAGVSHLLAVLLSLLAVAAIMVLTERYAVRPALRIAGSMGWAVATLGVGIILQGVAALYFGSQAVAFPDMIFSAEDNVEVFGVRVALQYLVIFVLSVLLALLLELLLRRTVWGRAMQAVSMDPDLAAVAGIPVRAIVTASFIASGVLAGIAGILIAQIGGTVDPAFGFELMIFGFVAAVLGGMGSSMGALAGGIIVGVLEKMVGGFVSTAAQHGIAFAVLIVMLVVRPQGLFGQKEITKA